MRIEHKCSCGATVIFEDNRGTFINTGGRQDDKGRVFQVEIASDKWLELHKHCQKNLITVEG
jgi:hypothetical protein